MKDSGLLALLPTYVGARGRGGNEEEEGRWRPEEEEANIYVSVRREQGEVWREHTTSKILL